MRILLKNVCKSYKKRVVLNRVNLSIGQGEIVGLLGPNGAGKTTTFYVLVGLERPTEGSVWLDERNITAMPLHQRARKGITYLPQETSAFRHLSVIENILLVMEQTRVPVLERSARLDALLAEFHLEKVATSLATQISGGQSRRMELARALAAGRTGPSLLLLDEPFAGIDPIVVSEIQTMLARLRDRGIGILITDHNVRETLKIVDRAYILREGEILASGTAEELYTNSLVREYYLGRDFQL